MRAKHRQSGFALLLFMVVLIGFITAGVSGFLTSSVKQKNEQAKAKTMAALLQAKEALLSYAVDYRVEDKGPGGSPDGNVDLYRMGRLPCPDASDTAFSGDIEGNQDPTCGGKSINSIGYFPFKAVGLGKLEDGNGECLWYVVSGDYKNNISADMLNRDSVGYLNVVDENGNLKHGANEDEFPIALIISSGTALDGQNRTPDTALPECHSNYNVSDYLEGGVNIDYSTDHQATADTLWKFLDTSVSTHLENADHNDQVIAIYRHELWDRVEAMNDLAFDNSAGVAAVSSIEKLTKSLAECIAAYGNSDVKRRLPYPASIDLSDYRNNSNYDDAIIRYGRFPQVVNSSIINSNNFVMGTLASQSFCEYHGPNPLPLPGPGTTPIVSAYDQLLWKNWKDHFFYWVSDDFNSGAIVAAGGQKCTGSGGSNGCIKVNSTASKVAAVIVFAGEVDAGQSRIWSWNSVTASENLPDEKAVISNYLEGGDEISYLGNTQNYNMSTIETDYAYCVYQELASPFQLTVAKCNDL